ncbi:MAG: hypothetical protein K8R23_18405 [Chthoniobacter sp.]|nr:hypothetical protein [Chthoniobacter sp.]
MADSNEPEKIWDEYEWERFLQQQDRKTEKYMELLERYIDDPNRDQIIAREMGWYHLLDKEGEAWEEKVESLFEEVFEEDRDDEAIAKAFDEEVHGYEGHPLYLAAFALTIWIDQFSDEIDDAPNQPSCVKLSANASIASAKLAAALSDDDVDEIGMTIAYLKRALKAVMNAMDAAVQLKKEVDLRPEGFVSLNQRLFQIRDGIIQLMGENRIEWRRRYGSQ